METKICPHCGEHIQSEAIKCKYCKEMLADQVINVSSDSKQSLHHKTQELLPVESLITKENKANPILKILGFLFFIAIFVGVGSLSKQFFSNLGSRPFDLNEVVYETNKSLPMRVDEYTVLDKITSSNSTIKYHYTADTIDKTQWTSQEINLLKDEMEEDLIENVRNSSDFNTLRNNNVTFIFDYNDMYGSSLFDVKVTPTQY